MHKKAGVVNAAEELRSLCEGGAGVAPVAACAAAAATTNAAAADATVIGDAGGYRLISADLRDIPSLDAALVSAGFDPDMPTLFLSVGAVQVEFGLPIVRKRMLSTPESIEHIEPFSGYKICLLSNATCTATYRSAAWCTWSPRRRLTCCGG
jgi:hypothetical protein